MTQVGEPWWIESVDVNNKQGYIWNPNLRDFENKDNMSKFTKNYIDFFVTLKSGNKIIDGKCDYNTARIIMLLQTELIFNKGGKNG